MFIILTMIAIIGLFDFWNFTYDIRNYESTKSNKSKSKNKSKLKK